MFISYLTILDVVSPLGCIEPSKYPTVMGPLVWQWLTKWDKVCAGLAILTLLNLSELFDSCAADCRPVS